MTLAGKARAELQARFYEEFWAFCAADIRCPLYHHPFKRGKRAGSNPRVRAGVGGAPSRVEMLARLFCPRL